MTSLGFASLRAPLERGGINTPVADGIGDACQCGDVTGNGIVNGQDGHAVQRAALGAQPNPLFGQSCHNALGAPVPSGL